jgi:hypothetical protein
MLTYGYQDCLVHDICSKEIVRLADIGVLEEDFSSEWASLFPTISIPKKNGIIRVVTDFRKLNLLLKHPISSVQLKGFPLTQHWT